MESTLVAALLERGILGIVIIGLGYVVATLYRENKRQAAELVELGKSWGATNEKVAAALKESTDALKESTEMNAQLRGYLERRGRS